MTSIMSHAAIVAAIATLAGGLTSPAAANTLKYTFGSVSGGAYCDGLTLSTTDGQTYTGEHTGCGGNLPAHGHRARGQGGPHLDIKTTYPGDDSSYVFLLYLKQHQWDEYVKIDGGLQLINTGILIKGSPANKGKSSRDTDPRALRDSVF